MDVGGVVERVRQVASVRADAAAGATEIEAALTSVARIEAWLSASKAALTSALAPQVSFPEERVADCTRTSLHDAVKDKERADTLDAVPPFADALDDAAITAGHVDALTKAIKGLDDDAQRDELRERAAGLLGVAS